jgi:hypothetical protein
MCFDAKAVAIDYCAGRHAGEHRNFGAGRPVGAKVIETDGFLGWGLQFLGAGVNLVPAPQVQVEEVNAQAKLKKDAESGELEE